MGGSGAPWRGGCAPWTRDVAPTERKSDERLPTARGDRGVDLLDGVADVPRATAIAQRLLEELSAPYLLENTPVQSSASIGVVTRIKIYGVMIFSDNGNCVTTAARTMPMIAPIE